MLQSINLIIRKSPGLESSILAVRAAWAMLSSGGYDVTIICLHEGTYALLPGPGYLPGLLQRFAETGGRIVTTKNNLEAYGLSVDKINNQTELLTETEIAELIEEADATTAY